MSCIDVPCPFCGARKGERCFNKGGFPADLRISWFHNMRKELAKKKGRTILS